MIRTIQIYLSLIVLSTCFFSCGGNKTNNIQKQKNLNYEINCKEAYFDKIEITNSTFLTKIDSTIELFDINLKSNLYLPKIGIIDILNVNETFEIELKVTNAHDFIKIDFIFQSICGVFPYKDVPFYFFSCDSTFFFKLLKNEVKVNICEIKLDDSKFIYPNYWQVDKYLTIEKDFFLIERKYDDNKIHYIK